MSFYSGLKSTKIKADLLCLFKIKVRDVYHAFRTADRSRRLPRSHVYERHGRIAEVPQQKQPTVVRVAVAAVALAQRNAVDSVFRWMAHDAKVGELHVDSLVYGEHLGESCEIVALGMQGVGNARVASNASGRSRLFHDIADDDECFVAEHLSKEVDSFVVYAVRRCSQ